MVYETLLTRGALDKEQWEPTFQHLLELVYFSGPAARVREIWAFDYQNCTNEQPNNVISASAYYLSISLHTYALFQHSSSMERSCVAFQTQIIFKGIVWWSQVTRPVLQHGTLLLG